MINWLQDTMTLPVAISFVLGMALGQIVGWYVCKRKGMESNNASRIQIVVGVAIVVAMLFIMVTTQRAHDCAVKLSATITTEQALASQERKALQDLFLAAMSPPPDIAALPQDDPRRVAWGKGIGGSYIDTINKTTKARSENQADREAAQATCSA